MIRRVGAAIVLAVMLAAPADAHITPRPASVDAGVATTVAFETPNERLGRATVALELTAPPGVTLAAADAPDGWRLELTGRTSRWTGGRIEGKRLIAFPLVVTADGPTGRIMVTARQRYDDGYAVTWRGSRTVLPATAPGDEVDRFDGRVIAGLVATALVAGSVIALLRLRRPLSHLALQVG